MNHHPSVKGSILFMLCDRSGALPIMFALLRQANQTTYCLWDTALPFRCMVQTTDKECAHVIFTEPGSMCSKIRAWNPGNTISGNNQEPKAGPDRCEVLSQASVLLPGVWCETSAFIVTVDRTAFSRIKAASAVRRFRTEKKCGVSFLC